MKKYRVKQKWNGDIFGEYNSRKEASDILMEYINDFNKDLNVNYISPFDFELAEVECREVNKVITDFETAREAINLKPNDDFTVVQRYSENIMRIEDVAWLVNDLNPKHIEALIALNRLFTIAEAWNKADGFVPDFSDWNQKKWYPWFIYDKEAARFVCASMCSMASHASTYLGSRLCFKSSARATQFGKQFADLYNKVFLP